MTTGGNLYQYIKDGIDQEYSAFLNTAYGNRLIRESIILVAEKMYLNNRTQKTADELSPLTVLDAQIPVRNNRFHTSPLRVASVTFIGTTVTLTTDQQHQLAVGDTITVSDVQGITVGGAYTIVSVPSPTQVTFIEPAVAGVYVPNTGNVTHGYMLPNMQHPLAIETTFLEDVPVNVFGIGTVVTAPDPYVSFAEKNTVRTSSVIRISGALGVTGLNGTFYTKQRNRNSYYLFLDANFTQPAVLSGTYQGGGAARVVAKEYATKLHSDRRIAPSSNAKVWRPKYGISDNTIELYPKQNICESVTVDYLKQPPFEVSVTDSTLDLELFYNFKFLMRVKDECIVQYMLRMRELPQAQAEMVNTNINQ